VGRGTKENEPYAKITPALSARNLRRDGFAMLEFAKEFANLRVPI
jgi:hypothetical protein